MAAVLKTANRGDSVRGFESHALRPDCRRADRAAMPVRTGTSIFGPRPEHGAPQHGSPEPVKNSAAHTGRDLSGMSRSVLLVKGFTDEEDTHELCLDPHNHRR